jgi:hypothetical protein
MMYVIIGKALEGVSEEKFNSDDNLFRGAVITILVDNPVDTYHQKKMGRLFGRLLRLSTELRTQAVSCM